MVNPRSQQWDWIKFMLTRFDMCERPCKFYVLKYKNYENNRCKCQREILVEYMLGVILVYAARSIVIVTLMYLIK